MKPSSFLYATVVCVTCGLFAVQHSRAFGATPSTRATSPTVAATMPSNRGGGDADARAAVGQLLERHALRISSTPGEMRGFTMLLNMSEAEDFNPVELRLDYAGDEPRLMVLKDGKPYVCVQGGLLVMAAPGQLLYQTDTHFALSLGVNAKAKSLKFTCSLQRAGEASSVGVDLGSVLRGILDKAKQVTLNDQRELTVLSGDGKTVARVRAEGIETFPLESIAFFGKADSRHPRLVFQDFREPVKADAVGPIAVEQLKTLGVPVERTQDLPPELRNPSWMFSVVTGANDAATRRAASELEKLLLGGE